MLSIIHHDDRISVSLNGRLVGSVAEGLRHAVCPATALDIDLSRLTFVDHEGEQSLIWLRSMGATFRGNGRFARTLCRKAGIPLLPSADGRSGERGAEIRDALGSCSPANYGDAECIARPARILENWERDATGKNEMMNVRGL